VGAAIRLDRREVRPSTRGRIAALSATATRASIPTAFVQSLGRLSAALLDL
jgi:hypothetical protein